MPKLSAKNEGNSRIFFKKICCNSLSVKKEDKKVVIKKRNLHLIREIKTKKQIFSCYSSDTVCIFMAISSSHS